MVQFGTMINGVLVFDGPPPPDGTRLRLEPAADDLWNELEQLPPPPTTESRAEFLESLRQSVAETRAGIPGMTVDEAMAAVDAELAKFAPRKS